jgi:hypothetical protein
MSFSVLCALVLIFGRRDTRIRHSQDSLHIAELKLTRSLCVQSNDVSVEIRDTRQTKDMNYDSGDVNLF